MSCIIAEERIQTHFALSQYGKIVLSTPVRRIGEIEVQLQFCITSTLDGGGWLLPRFSSINIYRPTYIFIHPKWKLLRRRQKRSINLNEYKNSKCFAQLDIFKLVDTGPTPSILGYSPSTLLAANSIVRTRCYMKKEEIVTSNLHHIAYPKENRSKGERNNGR
jgi:hypothetical protein